MFTIYFKHICLDTVIDSELDTSTQHVQILIIHFLKKKKYRSITASIETSLFRDHDSC